MFLKMRVNENTRRMVFEDAKSTAGVVGDSNVDGIIFYLPENSEYFEFQNAVVYVVFFDATNTSHKQVLDQIDDYSGMPKWTFDDNVLKNDATSQVPFFLHMVVSDTSGKVLKSWNTLPSAFIVYKNRDYNNQEEEAIRETDIDRLAGLVTTLTEKAKTIGDVEKVLASITGSSPKPVDTETKMIDDGHIYLYTGNETGFVTGALYYYIDGDLTYGGVYGSYDLDTTLTEAGKAADAGAVGAAIDEVKEDLDDNVNNLKSALTDITVEKIGKNIFFSEWSENGHGLDFNTGEDKPLSGQQTTGFVKVEENTTYTASTDFGKAPSVYLFYYNSSKELLSYYQTTYGFYPKTFTTPADCAYVRFLQSYQAMPTHFQVEKGSGATAYEEPYNILKVPYSAIDDASNPITLNDSKNLGYEWESGNINLDTGLNANGNGKRSQYVPVEEGKTYAFNINEYKNAYSVYIYYYDETKNPIKIDNKYYQQLPYGFFPKTVTVPTGYSIAFIRFSFYTSGSIDTTNGQAEENIISTTFRNHSDKEVDKSLLPNPVSGYINKKIVVFGDSITALGDVDSTASGGWTSWFKASVKPSLWRNYAVGGSTVCDYSSGDFLSEQIDSFLNSGISDVDCFIIASGTNDMNHTIPSDEDVETQFYDSNMDVIPVDDVDKTTWTGALRYAVEKLRVNSGKAKIFVCTPLNRTYDSNEPIRSKYETISDKCEIIKKMCKRLGVECIDTHECGVYGSSRYLIDRLHPTPVGARIMSQYIISRYMLWFNIE